MTSRRYLVRGGSVSLKRLPDRRPGDPRYELRVEPRGGEPVSVELSRAQLDSLLRGMMEQIDAPDDKQA